MAITTIDGVIAGMLPPFPFLKVGVTMEAAGILCSQALLAGSPGAMTAPSSGLNGAAITGYRAGMIPWTNPASGNSYLARLSAFCTLTGRLLLCDRLYDNSGYTQATTSAENTTHAGLPSRCPVKATPTGAPDANGWQVQLALEVYTATTNAGAITNTTAVYTNDAGTGSKTATIASFPATAVAGTFVPFRLASGDTGVRSFQSLTKGTSYGGGTMGLVQYRVIASLSVGQLNVGNEQDAVSLGMPRLYDDSNLFLLWLPTATTAVTLGGEIIVCQG